METLNLPKRPDEEQASEKYGSWYRAGLADAGMKREGGGNEIG